MGHAHCVFGEDGKRTMNRSTSLKCKYEEICTAATILTFFSVIVDFASKRRVSELNN